MQKKFLRIIIFLSCYDHTNTFFSEHRFLKIHDIINLQTYIFVYSSLFIFYNDSSFQFNNLYINTWHANQLHIPRFRTSHTQQCTNVGRICGTNFQKNLDLQFLGYLVKNMFFQSALSQISSMGPLKALLNGPRHHVQINLTITVYVMPNKYINISYLFISFFPANYFPPTFQ